MCTAEGKWCNRPGRQSGSVTKSKDPNRMTQPRHFLTGKERADPPTKRSVNVHSYVTSKS